MLLYVIELKILLLYNTIFYSQFPVTSRFSNKKNKLFAEIVVLSLVKSFNIHFSKYFNKFSDYDWLFIAVKYINFKDSLSTYISLLVFKNLVE